MTNQTGYSTKAEAKAAARALEVAEFERLQQLLDEEMERAAVAFYASKTKKTEGRTSWFASVRKRVSRTRERVR